MTGWERLGIGGLSQGFLSGRLSPSAALDDSLAGIAAIDDDLSAFCRDRRRRRRAAAAAAAELKRGRWRGQLRGVPIAVKELFDVAHLPATYGSHTLAGAVASAGAEVIRCLRRAGAVIVGLTRSHEFGWGITAQHPSGAGTRNPWHPDFISGGSSGGSAAAVAVGLIPAAVASDTGGSIRIPRPAGQPAGPGSARRRRHPPAARDRRHHAAGHSRHRTARRRGETTLANRKSRITRRRVATHSVRANGPLHTISGICGFGA